MCVLARIFEGPHFSAIHSIAYFTFEQVAVAHSIDSDITVWVDMSVRGEGVPRALLSDLHTAGENASKSNLDERFAALMAGVFLKN